MKNYPVFTVRSCLTTGLSLLTVQMNCEKKSSLSGYTDFITTNFVVCSKRQHWKREQIKGIWKAFIALHLVLQWKSHRNSCVKIRKEMEVPTLLASCWQTIACSGYECQFPKVTEIAFRPPDKPL